MTEGEKGMDPEAEKAAFAAHIAPHVGAGASLDREKLFELAELNGQGDLRGIYGRLRPEQLLASISTRLRPVWRRGELKLPDAPAAPAPSGGLVHHMIDGGPRPVAPFSHAVETDGWVILTGQMPTDPAAPDAALPEGIEAQTARVMENLKLILAGLGLGLEHVAQCRCYLTEFERDYAAFNETYKAFFPEDRLPARTTVGVTALAVGALVEIDCIARRPGV